MEIKQKKWIVVATLDAFLASWLGSAASCSVMLLS